MDCPTHALEKDTLVKTHKVLKPTTGFLITERHLKARRADSVGKIWGLVPGHGGDVYWVLHEGDENAAAYCCAEFELDTPVPDVWDKLKHDPLAE